MNVVDFIAWFGQQPLYVAGAMVLAALMLVSSLFDRR